MSASGSVGTFQDDRAVVDTIDLFRAQATRSLDPRRRSEFGQFLTPPSVGQFMASMFARVSERVKLLDPGAGSGVLFAATVLELTARDQPPAQISVTAYEIDETLLPFLQQTTAVCHELARKAGIEFQAEIIQADFISANVRALRPGLFKDAEESRFSHVIMNPPYGKVGSDSEVRRLLRQLGVETGNVYASFLALAIELMAPDGELVAITPRSFCNGPYFRQFRRWFLQRMALDRVHVFESRSATFRADDVLQENVIFHAVKSQEKSERVRISSSQGDTDGTETTRTVSYTSVVRPNDPDVFIHIVPDDWGSQVTDTMQRFQVSLDDLGLRVSTGRVVDFRARDLLRNMPAADTVPLIYPGHFDGGYVLWPRPGSRKPNALVLSARTEDLVVPAGIYVVVKRFSAKEEPRRIVAAVYDDERISPLPVGFENHLNYYHASGCGLPRLLARGLAGYLNSSLVDQYFRHFSGHTQVNATDLRRLRYPSREELERLGALISEERFPAQRELDDLVREELLTMGGQKGDPINARRRVEDALEVIEAVGMPRAQVNERSALTLLALLDLGPDTPWSKASNPLRGITPIMEFARERYGKNYAPNTRETFRRQTMHQFVDAGIAVSNPDDPNRAVNSPDYAYQIETSALELMRKYGSRLWKKALAGYLASNETLRTKYAQERRMQRIAIRMPGGITLNLTPGGQNVLIEKIVEEFCPRFTPGCIPLYIGDTGDKFAYFERDALATLGVTIAEHGKMPDVLVHHVEPDWLVIIEAVTSHGPVDPKRRRELAKMFATSRAGLVFVTAFLSRETMLGYLSEIAWETEVWVAEDPSHMIHFNGERFLGPYPS